jgi:hypothetical protein
MLLNYFCLIQNNLRNVDGSYKIYNMVDDKIEKNQMHKKIKKIAFWNKKNECTDLGVM